MNEKRLAAAILVASLANSYHDYDRPLKLSSHHLHAFSKTQAKQHQYTVLLYMKKYGTGICANINDDASQWLDDDFKSRNKIFQFRWLDECLGINIWIVKW